MGLFSLVIGCGILIGYGEYSKVRQGNVNLQTVESQIDRMNTEKVLYEKLNKHWMTKEEFIQCQEEGYLLDCCFYY